MKNDTKLVLGASIIVFIGLGCVVGGITWLFMQLGWDALKYLGTVILGATLCRLGADMLEGLVSE